MKSLKISDLSTVTIYIELYLRSPDNSDQKIRWRFTGRCWQLYAPTQTKKTRFSPGVSSIYEKHSVQELFPLTAALYVSMQLKCNSTQLQHLKWFHGLQFSSWSLFLSWELRDQLASQQTDECNKMQQKQIQLLLSSDIFVFIFFYLNRLVELDKLKQLSRKQERKETVSMNLNIHWMYIFYNNFVSKAEFTALFSWQGWKIRT